MSRFSSDSYRVVSSANILQINSIMKARSLMNNKKKSGPRTLPCGTPRFIDSNDEFELLNLTVCDR